MVTIGDALIIGSFILNIEFALYIFCPKFKAWIDNMLEEEC